MKKILIILILILTASIGYSQAVDTTVWGFKQNNVSGLYTHIYNKTTFMGIGANQFLIPIALVNDGDIDTSIWEFYANTVNGMYDYVKNKVEWYGLSAYTVKANLINPVEELGSSDFNSDSLWAYLDTTRIAFYDKDGTFLGVMTFSGDVYMSRAYIDTLITHTIDSLGSLLILSLSGDTNVYFGAALDTQYIKHLKVGRLDGGTFITQDSVTTPKVVIPSGTAWYFNIGGVDYWFLDATGFYPALTSAYNFGSSTYLIDSIRANHLQLFEHFIGNTQIRDTNSFDNEAASDTVTVTGASVSDLYFIQTMGQVVDAEDFCVVEPTATGFIVRRSASGTANLRYAWWRLK